MSTLEGIRVSFVRDGVAVAYVSDEHDLATADELSALLHGLVGQHELVVLDFSDAIFIDSSMLHVVLSTHKLALERGGRVRLQLGEECLVKRTFEISGMLKELSWASSREEALNGSQPTVNHDGSGEHDGSRR